MRRPWRSRNQFAERDGSGAAHLDMTGRVGRQGEDLPGSSGNHSAGGKESLARIRETVEPPEVL